MNSATDYTICNLDSQTYTTGYGGRGTSNESVGAGRGGLLGNVPHGILPLHSYAGGCGYSRLGNVDSSRNELIADGVSLYGLSEEECISSGNTVSSSPPVLRNPRTVEDGSGLEFKSSPVVSSPSMNDRQSAGEQLIGDHQHSRSNGRNQNGSSTESSGSVNGNVVYGGGPMSPVSYPIQPSVSTCAATTPPGYDAYYDVNSARATGLSAGNLTATGALNAANALCTAGGCPPVYPYSSHDHESVDLLQPHNSYHTPTGHLSAVGNVSPPLLQHHPQLHHGHLGGGHNLTNPHHPQHNLHTNMSHPHGAHTLGTPPQMHHSTSGCGSTSSSVNVLQSSQHHTNHQPTSLSPQQASSDSGVATYKWMTVKRGNTSKCK